MMYSIIYKKDKLSLEQSSIQYKRVPALLWLQKLHCNLNFNSVNVHLDISCSITTTTKHELPPSQYKLQVGNQYLSFKYNFYVYVLASNVPRLICLSQPIISVQWKLCNENYQIIPGFANSSRKSSEVSTGDYILCLLFKIQQFILLYGVYYTISTNKHGFFICTE